MHENQNFWCNKFLTPIPVAERFNDLIVLHPSNTEIVGSNATRGMDVYAIPFVSWWGFAMCQS
jgi:hypothetical protein